MDIPPRLVPDADLPPYSYVTGRFPHPTRDPAGHSFGHAAVAAVAIDERNWRTSRDYLFGCDLFNHGYYWEAHETWEAVWKACGRQGAAADFLKGLIKLAAAGVKAREGRSAGIVRHARRAVELFESVRREISGDAFLGFDLGSLVQVAERLGQRPITLETSAPVAIVFDFQLTPMVEKNE